MMMMHSNNREEIDEAFAGDIIALAGLKDTTTGDTLCDKQNPVVLETMTFPDPVIEIAIEPKTKADQEKMSQELGVSLLRLLDHGNPLARDHQEVDRGLGTDVIEGHALVIFMDKLGWDGAVKDLVKDGGTFRPAVTHV